jgi:two-component system cell cycle sensor histidine kinase/response regulator CckA
MSLSLFALFLYPQYSLYIIISAVVWNILCILITIRVLKVSENAIGFGALAAEILNDKNKYHRVDNAQGIPILVNVPAKDYFKDMSVPKFLEKNITNNGANKLDLQKLNEAVDKLRAVTVDLSINPNEDSVFVAEEWLRVSVKPIYLNKTAIFEDEYSLKKIKKEAYLFWTVENITAYKNMEQVFQAEMTSLHNFLDFLPVGLYTCNSNGKIEYINNTLADCLKTDKNSAIGKSLDDYVAYKPEQLHNSNGEFSGNIIFKSEKGNRELFVKQQNMREETEVKTHGVAIADLPNDSSLRNSLHEISDKFDGLFDTVPVGIVFADNKGNIKEVNAYILRLFEKSAEEIKKKKIYTYFKSDAQTKIKEMLADSSDNGDTVAGFETVFDFTPETKNVQVYVCPIKKHYYTNEDEAGGMIMYLTDTTSRRNLEMQVAQAQKMQAFGQLAGGVAHDFNNLLTAVIGYCDLLIQRHGVGDPSFSDLVQLKHNANRAAGVARQLLTISRKQPLNPKLIDVTEAFADLEHLLERLGGEHIKLQINYGTDLGYIRVDPVQFSQVMINLMINAKDAMNGKGLLTISTRSERLSEPYHFGADIIKPGDFIVISVSDTGCGIPPENINRIFEPFFSTKKNVVGSGTGLGLAMVYGIVRQTEGFIVVHSEVGKGTTFEIYLPAYESDKQEVVATEQKEEVIRDKSGKAAMTTPVNIGGANKPILGMNVSKFDSQRKVVHNPGETRILFVEDEDAVRTVGARGLRQKGFDVVDCISAENALEHIENGEHFDLMITDMMMPGMSGADLAKVMHKKNPQTLIILASGYSEEIARKELAGSQDFYFIGKPYSLENLREKIMEVLAENDRNNG